MGRNPQWGLLFILSYPKTTKKKSCLECEQELMDPIFIPGLLGTALLRFGLQGSGARQFSVSSIKGTCIWQSAAYPTISSSAEFAGPSAKLSAITFDGHRNFTYTSPASHKGLTFDFRMSREGQVIHTMTDSYADQSEAPQVDSGTYSFDNQSCLKTSQMSPHLEARILSARARSGRRPHFQGPANWPQI